MNIERGRLLDADPRLIGAVTRALVGLHQPIQQSGLEESLLYLIETRASQINGCAYCLDMHTKDARAHGESEQRLYLLSAWRESPQFSDRERAALAWTEAVTLVADGYVPDAAYEEARRAFTDDELLGLTAVVIAINAFNRLNVSLRVVPGSYQPGMWNTSAA